MAFIDQETIIGEAFSILEIVIVVAEAALGAGFTVQAMPCAICHCRFSSGFTSACAGHRIAIGTYRAYVVLVASLTVCNITGDSGTIGLG